MSKLPAAIALACLAAVAAAAGCASHPVHLVNEVSETRGDATYRSTALGNDVVILVQRELGETRAAGDAVIRDATLAGAEASPHHTLAGARAWLAVSTLAHGGDAYAAAKRGVDELGRDPAVFAGFDGMSREGLADVNASSNPDGAAETLRSVLRARIAQYVRHYAGAVE